MQTSELADLKQKVQQSELPKGLKESVVTRLTQLAKLVNSPTFLPEYDRINKYIEWIVSIPWDRVTKDNLDIVNVKKVLDRRHHGLETVKARILEYVSVMKLKDGKGELGEVTRAPILCFVGLVGTGKTTIAKSIAEGLGREFARIPFGGMGSPRDLRGQSRMHSESEPGKVIKALISTKARNPVILLDEIDRVTDEGRASIMGVLVELLDPQQNQKFVDHYVDYPVDLSQVLFIATANNTHHIATAVLDRLEIIGMPSYTDSEKIVIGRDYVLPRALKAAGIDASKLTVSQEVWPLVVRPLGYDAGIRTLERTINAIVRKVAREMVEGVTETFELTPENIKAYIPS